ncbi:MAG: MBL fold metallo-hydrolase [Natronospirillum sp.]
MALSVHRYYVPDSLQNYNHLVVAGQTAACVDPFDWPLAQREAALLGTEISEIWITHGHHDHTAGVPSDFSGLIRGHPDISRCQITAPINADDSFQFAGHRVEVLTTPGHTFDHLCFYLPEIPAVLVGDTLFNAGVGNTRGGDVDVLFDSILKLTQLPAQTQVYNGHDYMPTNVAFTQSITGATAVTAHWQQRCEQTTAATRPITTLADEHELNLFLRLAEPDVTQALNLPPNTSPREVFRSLRKRRDQW